MSQVAESRAEAAQAKAPPPQDLPVPPFITKVEGLFNLRSVGGLPISNSPSGSKTSKTKGHIFRSGETCHLAANSIGTLRDELGVVAIFDLRSRGELERGVLSPIPGIDNRHTPVYENKDAGPAEIAKTVAKYGDSESIDGFLASYMNILNEGANAYRAFFTHLLEKPGQGVLLHCTAGKDRTGVGIALVLELAAVSDEDIADEYALTDMGLREWKEGVVKLLLASPGLEGNEVKIRRMLSSRREVMVAFLQKMREQHGDARGYLTKKLGFSEQEVDQIRQNIVQEG